MFAQLESAWAHRALILAAVVAFLLAFAKTEQEKIVAINAQLAARPAETSQVQVVRVQGPVHVETKTVYVPGTTRVQYVDRFVTQEPVTTTTEAEKTITPAGPAASTPSAKQPWRYVGVTLDPLAYGQPRALAAGVAFWNMEGGLDYDWKYHALGFDARVRF